MQQHKMRVSCNKFGDWVVTRKRTGGVQVWAMFMTWRQAYNFAYEMMYGRDD